MESVKDLAGLLRSVGVDVSLGTYLKPLFNRLRVSGIGIIPGTIPDQVRLRLSRRYTKKGKVVLFENMPVKELEEFREYVYFLASRLMLHGEESDIEPYTNIGVYYFEISPPSKRLKLRFKPWEIYRGRVCVGKFCEEVKWLISIPTYYRFSYLFLSSPEDMQRKWIDERGDLHITNITRTLVEKYLFGEKRGRRFLTIREVLAVPIFSYQ